MPEIKLKIIGDLGKLEKDLQNLFKKKFKAGLTGGGGDGGGTNAPKKQSKKQTSLLGGIFKKLFPLALLLSLQPIADLLKILTGFVFLGIMELLKWIKMIPEGLKSIWTIIIEWLKYGWNWLVETIINLKDKLVETIKTWWQIAIDWIKALPGRIWEWLKSGFNWLVEKIVSLKDRLIEWLETLWNSFVEGIQFLGELLKLGWEVIKVWFKKAIEWIKLLPGKIWNFLKLGFNWLKEKLATMISWIKQLPQLIWDKMKALAGMIASAISGIIDKLNPFRRKDKVDDAIIKPNGTIIRTNPNDTIIATQNPNGIGGGHTFNYYGVAPEEFLQRIKNELGVEVNLSSRF